MRALVLICLCILLLPATASAQVRRGRAPLNRRGAAVVGRPARIVAGPRRPPRPLARIRQAVRRVVRPLR